MSSRSDGKTPKPRLRNELVGETVERCAAKPSHLDPAANTSAKINERERRLNRFRCALLVRRHAPCQ